MHASESATLLVIEWADGLEMSDVAVDMICDGDYQLTEDLRSYDGAPDVIVRRAQPFELVRARS